MADTPLRDRDDLSVRETPPPEPVVTEGWAGALAAEPPAPPEKPIVRIDADGNVTVVSRAVTKPEMSVAEDGSVTVVWTDGDA